MGKSCWPENQYACQDLSVWNIKRQKSHLLEQNVFLQSITCLPEKKKFFGTSSILACGKSHELPTDPLFTLLLPSDFHFLKCCGSWKLQKYRHHLPEWVFVLFQGVLVLVQGFLVLVQGVLVLVQGVLVLVQGVFILVQWVLVLVQRVFILVRGIFMLVQGVSVLVQGVLGFVFWVFILKTPVLYNVLHRTVLAIVVDESHTVEERRTA